MKILVTGGAGFIGSHLVDAYIEAGHHVIIFDNLSTGVKKNLNPQAKFFAVDIRSDQASEIFLSEKPDILNHHAAQIRIDVAAKDPITDLEINTIGLLKLLESAKNEKFLKKVIFASTGGAMYGHKPTPFTESMIPQPLSPYGISKRASELYLYFYKEAHHLPYTALRYANVYGPRQNPYGEAGVISIFCAKLLTGKTPIINGDGLQTRDYVFVADVVRANTFATEKDVGGEFNIGTGKETNVNEIYALVAKNLNLSVVAKHGPPRSGEQKTSSLDSSKAKLELGWEPTVPLEEGIAQTTAFFKSFTRRPSAA
ncbi:MAG: NAD-dependent epimerase/dehydratase family protein [Candidatus Chisholmbacteria bacterium]|nr:NAD-dependent epimerase/dehydratase family protein [Candidatus Chisholmbacteria bacterium]